MATIATGSQPLPRALPVKFTEAIEFMRAKLRLPTRVWTDLWEDMHARAFVVAGAMKDALVKDFHEAVTRAIDEGRTLEQFREDFDKIVAAHGWDYKGGRNWRSAVIYNTNMRMAHSAGRWAQIQRLKEQRPYIRYVTMADERVRESHAVLHDIVLPVDHPFWLVYFPPNDWGCRCSVMSLTEDDLKRLGLKVTPDADLPTGTKKHRINTPEGPVEIDVPVGVSPGFAYNPGAGAFGRGVNEAMIGKHDRFEPLEAPIPRRDGLPPLDLQETATRPAPPPPRHEDGRPIAQALHRAFNRAVGADEGIFADPAGGRVSVTRAIVDHLLAKKTTNDVNRAIYWPFIPELVEKPQEVWVGFARDKVTGKVGLRRRYISFFNLGKDGSGKPRILALVADQEQGYWQGLTAFTGRPGTDLDRLRTGVLVYKKGRE